jgi:hypothetical protein
MELDERQQRIEAAVRTTQILHAALIAGVVIAGAVAYFLLAGGHYQPPASGSLVAWNLVTAGFLLLIATPFVLQWLARRAAAQEEGGVAPPQSGDELLRATLERFTRQAIVGAALRESAGILGAVTVLVTGEVLAGFGLLLAALYTLLRSWPSRAQVKDPAV